MAGSALAGSSRTSASIAAIAAAAADASAGRCRGSFDSIRATSSSIAAGNSPRDRRRGASSKSTLPRSAIMLSAVNAATPVRHS